MKTRISRRGFLAGTTAAGLTLAAPAIVRAAGGELRVLTWEGYAEPEWVEPFKAVPTHVTWDVDNKSTALRVLSGSASSARIEHRMGAGDLHPHMAAAAILAGGMAGLDEQLEPPPPFERMAWGLPDGEAMPDRLPVSVTAACDALGSDQRLRAMLGDELVDYWIGVRRFEWLAFNTSGGDITSDGPTPWELDRYFETL